MLQVSKISGRRRSLWQLVCRTDRLTCAEAAVSAAVVDRCNKWFAGNDRLECSKSAKSPDAVDRCGNWFAGADRLTCSASALSGPQVDACSQQFAGTDRLRCLTNHDDFSGAFWLTTLALLKSQSSARAQLFGLHSRSAISKINGRLRNQSSRPHRHPDPRKSARRGGGGEGNSLSAAIWCLATTPHSSRPQNGSRAYRELVPIV